MKPPIPAEANTSAGIGVSDSLEVMSEHPHWVRVEDDGDSPQASFHATSRAISWCATYIANLFVPGLFGLGVCGNGVGLAGMALGVLTLGAVGLVLVQRFAFIGRSLITGGLFVALTQLFPILQIFAGAAALDLWRSLAKPTGGGDLGADPLLQFLGGVSITMLTGQSLMFVAFVFGAIITLLRDKIEGKTTEPDDEPAEP